MDQHTYIRLISGEAEGIGASLARSTLFLVSCLYYLGAWAKPTAYRVGLAGQDKVDAHVVSIGNISAGGTGKTPATVFFANRFLSEGRNVAVLSRGYGRMTRMDQPLAVSDRRQILLSPRESGDEPYLMAKKLMGVPVVVCSERVRGAQFAVDHFNADTIILDDGFQHLALARDEDIVVIDCSVPFGFGYVLPRGLLREPLHALKRASGFLLTHADQYSHTSTVKRLREINPGARILLSRHRPIGLINMRSGTRHSCDFVAGKKVLALSSIGNPQSFEKTLLQLQAVIAESQRFDDHHWYVPGEIQAIADKARASGAEFIVSTEKDGVRLELLPDLPDILLLEIALELIEEKESP